MLSCSYIVTTIKKYWLLVIKDVSSNFRLLNDKWYSLRSFIYCPLSSTSSKVLLFCFLKQSSLPMYYEFDELLLLFSSEISFLLSSGITIVGYSFKKACNFLSLYGKTLMVGITRFLNHCHPLVVFIKGFFS